MNRTGVACLAAAVALSCPSITAAQDSKSAPLARQLAAALDAGRSDSIAARDPGSPDGFIAALYFPGVELLVVSAKYSAPAVLNDKLLKKAYRDVYIDLNSTSLVEGKIFVEDMGANGIAAKHEENQPFDTVSIGNKATAFDGDWKRQKLSEDEYNKAFASDDDKYAQMLSVLLAQMKKTS
jgi:hypothetical protein